MMQTDFKIKCKRCGKLAVPEQFVLDPYFNMVVCPFCVKERKTKSYEEQNKGQVAPQTNMAIKPQVTNPNEKPMDWDKDDEYLEKVQKQKEDSKPVLKKIGGSKVRYPCTRCRFVFIYDEDRNYPVKCPYCGTPVNYMKF